MRLSTKLYGTVGALALTGVLVAGAGIIYIRTLGEDLSVATGKTAVKLDLVNAARARSWEMVAALEGTFLFSVLKKQEESDASAKRWEAAFKRTGEQITELRPLMTTEDGRKNLARFEAGLGGFQNTSVSYIRLCREHNLEQAADLTPKVHAFASLADETLNNLKVEQRKILKDSHAASESLRSQSLWVNIVMSGLLLAIVVVAVFVVRGINRALVAVAGELNEGADHMVRVASQVSSSSQSLAQGSSEQAASLEESSAASKEINSMAGKNSQESQTAASLASQSQQKFLQANQSLDQMVVAMGYINAQSDKIAKIIKVIDEIAFQTNILALNAAVEAARAGEAGMGFAVVADEVRNLAQRCAQAARDTTVMIEESIAKSNDGKVKVDQVAGAIRTMTKESGKMKTLMDQVNQGSQEQACGIEQIGKALTQMEQVTQTIAANAEETAASAQELNGEAGTLREVVKRLTAMAGAG